MAAFVKSTEEISVSVPDGVGLKTVETNLSKGQDAAKCVPFFSMRYINNGTPNRLINNLVSVETYDNAGTAATRVRRQMHPTDPDGDVELTIYVVEFGDSVTIQKGVHQFPVATRSTTETISAVVQGNSFIVCSQHVTGGSGNNDWGQAFLGASFNSDTEIQFDRDQGNLSAGYELDVPWYVVESNGTDFQTEFVEYLWGSSESGPTDITLSNSVDLDHSFVVPTFVLDGYTDGALNFGLGVSLTAATTLTFNRNGGGTKNRPGTIQTWVVRSAAAAVNTQRFEADVTGVTITDETVTAVDLSKAVVMDGGHCGTNSAFATLSSSSGARQYQAIHEIGLTSTTNVRLQRRTANISGTNLIQVEVVEFELEPEGVVVIPAEAAAASSAIDPGVVLGSVAVTPAVASAVGSAVDPTFVHGSLTITPEVATVLATAIDPDVFIPGPTITPAPAAVAGTAINPVTILGSLVLSPDIAEVASAAVDPTVVISAGDITIIPTPAIVVSEAVDPGVVFSGTQVSPEAAEAGTEALLGQIFPQLWYPENPKHSNWDPEDPALDGWVPEGPPN